MNIRTAPSNQAGIALIIVLMVMTAFGILAGRFAYSMKVELALARTAAFDPELEWLGRSGIELARYVLGQSATGPNAAFDALNQKWAGGIGDTNSALADLPMTDVPLGNGLISVTITDADRKFNINVANDMILDQALIMVGVDASIASVVKSSIQDWRDRDNMTTMGGAEGDDYRSLPNPGFDPYVCKDGPFDDITELLYVRGVTPAMFWGGAEAGFAGPRMGSRRGGLDPEPVVYAVGLSEIFTPLSGRLLNINTASATALQVIPFIDQNIANEIILRRGGPDGVEGNEDDVPFRSPSEMLGFIPALDPAASQQLAALFTVRSLVFEARVDVRIGDIRREYVGVLRRNSPRDIQVLTLYWR